MRGYPEVLGQLPVATLADEIETPGQGQVRALVAIAGNPARSAPNSARLELAIASRVFMVSVDRYLNETSRHADVVLPPTDPARTGHYDYDLSATSLRNIAIYSRPSLPMTRDELDESDIWLRLMGGSRTRHPNSSSSLFSTAFLRRRWPTIRQQATV